MSLSEQGADLAPWLRLEQIPGLGPVNARRLLAAFGLPQNIFTTDLTTLSSLVSPSLAKSLRDPPSDAVKALIDLTLEWASQPGNRVITLADTDYPEGMLNIADPPIMLYAKGRTELLSRVSVAVVGSRNATIQGLANAEEFSEDLSRAGITIVSGLANGIDTAAHQGGLRGSGSTVSVIGTGADKVYPARNRALAHRLAEEGCILSEYPLGTPPMAPNFPRRNRIISGLAKGVLVVEAAAQSGSLITARLAADQGRDVYALPGSIHSPLSKGCHLLIRQGAKLVDCAEDILEELGLALAYSSRPSRPASPADEATLPPLLAAMGFDPVDPELLAVRCGIDMPLLQGELLSLELGNKIEILPGGMVRRLAAS
jgi:DNA processing protein